MKKLVLSIILLVSFISAKGQVIQDQSKWWDGMVLYTAHVLDDQRIYFDAVDNMEGTFQFTLKSINNYPGGYTLEPSNMVDEAPFRAQFGWTVKYTREDGMYFLSVLNPQGETVWTLVLTVDSLENSKGGARYARSMLLDDVADGYLASPAYLSDLSKSDLEYILKVINKLPSQTVISKSNASLIRSELKVVDDERSAYAQDVTNSIYNAPAPHANVEVFKTLPDAINSLAYRRYPAPVTYGERTGYESVFIVIPESDTYTLELWRVETNQEGEVILGAEAPLAIAMTGFPLCFSYCPPEIVPSMAVLCKNSDGVVISSWIPTFSGKDGSLITTREFQPYQGEK